jgi:hypothetical protein
MMISVSTSDADLSAMYRNWMYSLVEFLLAHSAMLLGIETATLLIWSESVYVSSFGSCFTIW